MSIGLDLGGTDLKAVRLADSGEVLAFARVPSRALESHSGPYEAAIAVLEALGSGDAGEARATIGFGCPGVIDPSTGVLRGATAHLPHWHDEPVRDELERRLGRRVVVDNDANLAALAEHRLGAGRDAHTLVLVTLGTGIGCGMVIDGRVHRGAWGGAGELGHIPLGDGALECACGVPGCVEPEASASGLV
ncbi:MAG: ROK family protein, partial [Candidatus Eisenbacteria bacterium]|nr:ROK family protein [Candidatus Eisenbacteria bacterium]